MHEYSIVQSLLHRVETEARAHGASAVRRVKMRIGELSGLEPELVRSAYDLVRAGGLCAAAELEIIPVAARWVCRACGREVAPGQILRCPVCQAPARLAGGDEIFLDSLELEVA